MVNNGVKLRKRLLYQYGYGNNRLLYRLEYSDLIVCCINRSILTVLIVVVSMVVLIMGLLF